MCTLYLNFCDAEKITTEYFQYLTVKMLPIKQNKTKQNHKDFCRAVRIGNIGWLKNLQF